MIGALQKLVAFSMCWLIMSSLAIYPHSLSYFNESIRGPFNGSKHLLGSNVDWGQDLRYLNWWYGQHPEIYSINFAFYGSYSPEDIGVYLERRQGLNDGVVNQDSDWYVANLNWLQGYPSFTSRNKSDNTIFHAKTRRNLSRIASTARIGYTIHLYHYPSALKRAH